MPQINCRSFSGYKPCPKNEICDSHCSQFSRVTEVIGIIHLGALGAVVRSTTLLAAIRRNHPAAKIVWITSTAALPLIQSHPRLDLALSDSFSDIMVAKSFQFDRLLVVDKSLQASGLARSLSSKRIFGFLSSDHGAILPATTAAEELWQLGLDNHRKFFVNKKPETQLIHEALELGSFFRDFYDLPLHPSEKIEARVRAETWSDSGRKFVIGINTGCSAVIPYKKLSVDFHRHLIHQISTWPNVSVVLLGGREDTERNQKIAEGFAVISSPTDQGLRDGLISVAACDAVLTGDSLGLHLAISQGKWVVAWFGPTCGHEIDLFDHGVKVLSQAECSPCWKRACQKESMCYDRVDSKEILMGLKKGFEIWQQTSLSKQLFSETSYSASP